MNLLETDIKSVLLKMMGELRDLRASLGPLVAASSHSLSPAAVLVAKNLAMQEHLEFYEALEKQIEGLA